MAPTNWGELRTEVVNSGGLKAYPMAVLRDVNGAGKLGRFVVQDISRELAENDMGHLPASLPLSQDEVVRVYIKNSKVGRLIAAVLNPTPAGDGVLRNAGSGEAQEILERVRALVREQS
jgi:hypothetical protein